MNDELASIATGTLLNPTPLDQLTDWESFISYYLQLDELDNYTSWTKADLLLKLSEKYGESSLAQFAKDVHKPHGTIINYIRTARAFPPEKRFLESTFTMHMVASFADSYDDKERGFTSVERYDWIEKAADNKWSTRSLVDEIKREKKKKELSVTILPCKYCHQGEEETFPYVFYSPRTSEPATKVDLHKKCFELFIGVLNNG